MNQIYEQYSQDPDETFRMYVDRLMRAQPKFGGTFATPPQQGQDATAKATGGLLTGLFPEYRSMVESAGDSYSDPAGGSSSGSLSGSATGRGDFASADSVVNADSLAASLAGGGRGLAQLGGALFGLPGMLLGGLAPRAADYYADRQWDSFNRGQDADAAARAEANSVGGIGTYSDVNGNIGTISTPGLVDAYDKATFGVTGSELASGGGGYDYGGSGGWGTAGHSDYGDGGYDGNW